MSHQSAEPCISINRLRCRLRHHTPTSQATTITPSPAPTVTPVETQAPVAPDVHSFTAPSMAVNTMIPVATLIPEGAIYFSPMNTIIAPLHILAFSWVACEGCQCSCVQVLEARLGGAYGCVSEAKYQIVGVAGRPGRTDAKENHEVFCFDQVTLSARASTSELGPATCQHFAVLRNRALGQLENLERTALVRATATDYSEREYLGQSVFNIYHMVSILDGLCASRPDTLLRAYACSSREPVSSACAHGRPMTNSA